MTECTVKNLRDIKGLLTVEVRVLECAVETWEGGKGQTLMAKVRDARDASEREMMLYLYGEKARNFYPMFKSGGCFRITGVNTIPPRTRETSIVLLNQTVALAVPNHGEVVPINV